MSATEPKPASSRPPRRKSAENAKKSWVKGKTESKLKEKQVMQIMKKKSSQRSKSEVKFLKENDVIVKELEKRVLRRNLAKLKKQEREDSPEEVVAKTEELARAMQSSKYCVVYTGAGISTAASIPDYRGPNGVWTLLQKGQIVKSRSLTDADPTFTHMSLAKLCREKIVQHVVSQNCDGLHRRSGIQRDQLSELHGNMYIEVCPECDQEQEYIRLFDVTERTSFRRHKTGRQCTKCLSPLHDTIVHFGEKGTLEWPLNWQGAIEAADKADMIVCMGSSLKVLKKYPCLWTTNRGVQNKTKIYIVNLQWTPKDYKAELKINAKCDDVMKIVMKKLSLEVQEYKRVNDPIFQVATALRPKETNTFTTKVLKIKKEEASDLETENKAGVTNDNPGWFGKGCRRKSVIRKRRRVERTVKSEI
ncbi:NAD-dependent protein deacetylase sirtuin-7-like [Anneissia japonica]|uniref:NAD-dependent protein deacetylase sirtuin-7-like n=1 Tax=Anneissia japonica TaxID=1529436 RepID=UPI00142563DC|nr:NAD-dependent protein deacetylase sirtuin-7-like [Anneissia japonica]